VNFSRLGTLPVYGLVFATSYAWAQASATDKALATQLYDDAESLIVAGNPVPACPKYAESYRLDPQLGVLLHLGDCYEKVGRTASAWSTFKEAVEIAALKKDDRESAIKAHTTELEAKLTRLTVVVAPNNPATTEVRKNGDVLGRPAWGTPIPVDPGIQKITATATGYQEWSALVDVRPASTNSQITIPALQPNPVPVAPPPMSTAPVAVAPIAPAPVSPTPIAAAPPPQQAGLLVAASNSSAKDDGVGDSRSGARTAGYVLGVVGAASLGVGAVFGILSSKKLSEREDANKCSATSSCTSSDLDYINKLTTDAKGDATIANIGLIVGGAALVTGVVLVLTNQPKTPPKTGAVDVQPWVGAGSAGCAVGGFW
jgi:hypothetical protein